MALEVLTFVLGPLENNTYLIANPDTSEAVVVDPSFEVNPVIEAIRKNGWHLKEIWLTHGHFDHTAGVQSIVDAFDEPIPIAIHPEDVALYRQGGGAAYFGVRMVPGPAPKEYFAHGQIKNLGDEAIEVRHTPGHTRGHVVFYLPSSQTVICGDLIFQGSVGRTDLPGGSMGTLIESIQKQILTLPPDTRLLSGHGEPTTVRDELLTNPYLP